MAGTIVSDTIQNGAGNSTSMDNAIYGSCKAWVSFTGSSGAITKSYNVSSVTRSSTGTYVINMTNAMLDTGYCVSGFAQNSGYNILTLCYSAGVALTTSSFPVSVVYNASSQIDATVINIMLVR
jgi:hypothetical protein